MMADAAPGNGAHGHGRIGRAEGGRAGRRDIDPAQARHDGERVDVAGLALVGAHAERGVALQMLDRLVALLMGDGEIVQAHVVLEIDEGLAACSCCAACQTGSIAAGFSGDGQRGDVVARRLMAAGRCSLAAGGNALANRAAPSRIRR